VDGITNELTQKGCRTLENWVVKKQGQATRRPGHTLPRKLRIQRRLLMFCQSS
jgi:hypothetical protein